jgi:hypothetical protein
MTLPDSDSLSTYGGAFADYGVSVVDPTTDQAAADYNKMAASVAMMTNTAIRAWAIFTTAATTGAMVLQSHGAVWGTSVAPTLSRNTTGTFDVTWPSTVTDELSVSHTVNIRGVLHPNPYGSGFVHAQASRQAANVVRVYTFSILGLADDMLGTDIFVAWV